MISFEELGIENEILSAVKELGFENPTPVQAQVLPHLMQDNFKDLIAMAQTGTGKTAAFGIPLIQKTDTTSKHTQFLVLAPTRELCLQIADDLSDYAKFKPEVKIAAVFGGSSIERQIQIIKKGAHIISATPGRLLDLIKRKVIDLRKIRIVVLDEADEMLNMGFRDELEAILSETPENKNTLLFSATMPQEVMRITNRYMKNPAEILIGRKNIGAENVNHLCYMVHAKERYLALKRIVDFNPDIYGIVFCRTRKETQEVADMLLKDGYNAESLHGDLSQSQRDAVMNKFRIKHLKLLVATDVAARGLDVNNLSHIINFNLPDDNEIYTHRSGRTGRAGKTGTSIVIANLKEKNRISQIEKQINKKFTYSSVPRGREICEKQLFYLIDRMEKVEVDDSEISSFLPEIFRKLEWLDREELIKKFVSMEFNRFLDYYKSKADLHDPVESKSNEREKSGLPTDRRKKEKRGERDFGQNNNFTRFFINLGKTDEIKPQNLIGMINDYTNVRSIDIGEIDIRKTFSFFEADSSYADLILKAFHKKFFKKREINIEVATKSKDGGKRKEFKKFSRDFDKPKSGKRKKR